MFHKVVAVILTLLCLNAGMGMPRLVEADEGSMDEREAHEQMNDLRHMLLKTDDQTDAKATFVKYLSEMRKITNSFNKTNPPDMFDREKRQLFLDEFRSTMAELYASGKEEEALAYGNKFTFQLREFNNESVRARSVSNEAVRVMMTQQPKEAKDAQIRSIAKKYVDDVIALYGKDDPVILTALENYANKLYVSYLFDASCEVYKQVEALYLKYLIKDHTAMVNVFPQICYAFIMANKRQEAEEYLKRFYAFYAFGSNDFLMVNNLIRMEKYEYAQKALDLYLAGTTETLTQERVDEVQKVKDTIRRML